MATLHDLVKSLIGELAKAQAPGAFPERIDGIPVMSGFVAVGDGSSLSLSQPMERLIIEISNVLKQNDLALVRSHTDQEWTQLVRKTFGPPLATIDLADDPDENAAAVLTAVRKGLAENTLSGPREYAFGCTLFSNDSVAGFAIGPVRFEPRLEWLGRKTTEGAVTTVTARRLRKRWLGKRVRKRTAVVEEIRETYIVDTIGNCGYVCSVATDGLASNAGKLKAQTAARLALTGVALWWETPSGALDGFNLLVDRTVRRQRTLVFVPSKITLADSTLQGRPHGPPIKPEEWEALLARNINEFAVMGQLIEFYLSPTGNVARPKLMNALAQAFIWFHEGCREQVDLMAIINFAACLDALASGGESAGILKLIKARLGPGPNDKLRPNGQTTSEVVKEIYGKGRSRTIHGTNENLGHDWTSTRRLSEALARYCLISCLTRASELAEDDPKILQS